MLAYCGVEVIRRWSLRRAVLAVPNERSLHDIPTPNGGGLAIVVVCLGFYAICTTLIYSNFSWSYFTGAVLISAISWLDDLYSVGVLWRFLVHTAAALLVIFGLGYFQEFYNPFGNFFVTGIFGAILTFFWIVWLTNAYNFMDGIDGLAGVQSVSAGIGWLLAGKILGIEDTTFYGGLLALSCAGFLIQNWQPAKIFMGDVGSAFLGYSFAVLPLLSVPKKGEFQTVLLIIAVVLLWLFIFDTVLTIIRRTMRGEKIWLAHRGHIYQRFIIGGFSHRFVTCVYGGLSFLNAGALLFWLNGSRHFGFIIIVLIGLESFGLLFFVWYYEKNKIKT